MYSRDDTVKAVLKFYEQVIRQPYLDDEALIIPPPNGWAVNDVPGKSETVNDLLRHLPYLRAKNAYERLVVNYETVPIDYSDDRNNQLVTEEIWPLPPHCVYLTRGVDHMGTNLILNTENGCVTEFSHDLTRIALPYDEYEALPDTDKWLAYVSLPVANLLAEWTRKYAEIEWMLLPNPIGQPVTGRFYAPDPGGVDSDDEESEENADESELDREQKRVRRRETKHTTAIYETFLSYGWPDDFRKHDCRVRLLEMERVKNAVDRQLMKEMDPDAALFD